MILPRPSGRRLGLLLAACCAALAAVPGGGSAQEAETPAEPRPEAQQEDAIDSPYRWIERSLRVGFYGGWWAAERGVMDLGPGPTGVGGARFRARVSSPLSLEAGLGLGASERFVVDPRLDEGPAVVDTVDAGWARLEAGVQVALTGARTWHRLQPYAVIGGGLLFGLGEERSDALGDGDGNGDGNGDGEPPADPAAELRYEVGTAPFFQGALGVEFLPGGRLGIGLEARDQLLRIRTPDGFFADEILNRIEELGLPAPRETEWTHHLEVSLTLWYYL